MAINIKEVEKLAKLSRIYFTDDEKQIFIKEFESILDQVKEMDKVDISNIDLKDCASGVMIQDLNDDIELVSLDRDKILLNAPNKQDGEFLVPITVDEGGSN